MMLFSMSDLGGEMQNWMRPILAFSMRVGPPAALAAFWSNTMPSTISLSSTVPPTLHVTRMSRRSSLQRSGGKGEVWVWVWVWGGWGGGGTRGGKGPQQRVRSHRGECRIGSGLVACVCTVVPGQVPGTTLCDRSWCGCSHFGPLRVHDLEHCVHCHGRQQVAVL